VWTEPARKRAWLACVFLLVAGQTARQTYTGWHESQTFDEGLHLSGGYAFLKTGEYRIDPEHPPLGRALAASALLALNPDLKLETDAWRNADAVEYGKAFLYHNRIPADTLIFRARLVVIALTAALALLLAFWTRARFGAAAGLLAVFLFTLDPNLSAHGHYVTTDMVGAATSFLACVLFGRFLRSGNALDAGWAGLALGVALVSKFSAIFLVPSFALLYVYALLRKTVRTRSIALHAAVVALSAAAVIVAAYGPESVKVAQKWRSGEATRLVDVANSKHVLDKVMHSAGKRLHLPAHPYFTGLHLLAEHDLRGHDSYFLGKLQKKGVWYYFPVVFAVKTPLGALLLLALCLPLVAVRIPGAWRWLKESQLEWALLAVPLAVYWAFCLTSHINIGLRHLLPVYPLLYALLAALWTRLARSLYGRGRGTPVLTAAVCLLTVGESAWIFPHDLAFFNAAAGGPANGANILVDSNLDWGQDLKNLKVWLDARGAGQDVCMMYFGSADQQYYGFPDNAIPPTESILKGEHPPCTYAAISVTPLKGVYIPFEWYSWLRQRKPVARIGWSIDVYDIWDVSGDWRK
jgi:hypothetical protein